MEKVISNLRLKSVRKKLALVAATLLMVLSPLYAVLGRMPTAHAASTISSNDVTVNEADGTANFSFSVDGLSDVQYTYRTVNGSAVSPDDYTATSGTLAFNSDGFASVSIPITDDQVAEPTESFNIEVYSNIDGPVLEGAWTATINDNDSQVVTTPVDSVPPSTDSAISSSNIEVNEGDGSATFTFVMNGFNGVDYTYKTVNGSAVAPGDYTASQGTLVFDNSDSNQHFATVTIPITDDGTLEPTESFNIEVYSNIDGPMLEGSWTATIIDNDEVVVTPPTDTPPTQTPPVVTPPPTPPTTTPTPPSPTPTTPATPSPTPTPTPTSFATPIFNPTPVLADITTIPEPAPAPEATPNLVPEPPILGVTPTPHIRTASPKPSDRSIFVKSVGSPKDIGFHAGKLVKSAIIAVLLILLIMFPADLFNSTLQSNYDEVVGWFKLDYVRKLHHKLQLHRMPIVIVLTIFGGLVTLLNVQLSPGLGFNRESLALLVGMFVALAFAATIYDLSRSWYMKRRFGIQGKLRAHALGLGAGALFVTVSRLAHFVPGYLYGLFTGLIYNKKEPTDKQDGEGLALASILLLSIALVGWFALIPVRTIATRPHASFIALVAESALASLWVSALGTIVFSLAPLRFMYGEQVKKWNNVMWAALWGVGMLLFVYTLLDPNQGVYNKSSTASWISVLSLFIGFGVFSFGFWGYFRFRPARVMTK